MEQKLYRLLGVNQYRRFIIQVKKKYDQWRGKPDTENYFLKDYSEEGIVFLKNQLIKNAAEHAAGSQSRTAPTQTHKTEYQPPKGGAIRQEIRHDFLPPSMAYKRRRTQYAG